MQWKTSITAGRDGSDSGICVLLALTDSSERLCRQESHTPLPEETPVLSITKSHKDIFLPERSSWIVFFLYLFSYADHAVNDRLSWDLLFLAFMLIDCQPADLICMSVKIYKTNLVWKKHMTILVLNAHINHSCPKCRIEQQQSSYSFAISYYRKILF